MPDSELMPIGVFARRTGLTPSALRFYDDSGVLTPSEVAPDTGYRYYGADQVERARAVRRLRELGMPLTEVAAVLDAGEGDGVRLIDEHVARVLGDAAEVRRRAVSVKASLAGALSAGVPSAGVPSLPVAVLKGPVLADAVEQVLTATVREPGLPVLGGVRVEATAEAFILTATDRYRLATRTLAPTEGAATDWAATVDGDELRAVVAEIRRSAVVRVEAGPHGVRLRMAGREDRYCAVLAAEFPDHRLMLASLPEVVTRVTVAKGELLGALGEQAGERVVLGVGSRGVGEPGVGDVGVTPHVLRVLPPGDYGSGVPLPAHVTGPALRITFDVTTLYPAVSTAIGPDVLLDLRGPDLPVTIRSADRGDLTTLAMPVRP
ncbi:MerR family transcriptional regulator [Streptomyces roseirectus]|uniref:MerR family transcriptional regulator n=1 Tax=Streptomyces roseirectus TaxID=2768066 RepID=A0A7H0IBS2_9ACTN|nr:MerR family transcriptional regulator [Streptomyces roseirectus]QNP70238.1 MerR family transcriptional regulator [Streptomyces roseirectus]